MGDFSNRAVNLDQLQWLRTVLYIPNDRLPQHTMLFDVVLSWEKSYE